MTKPKYRALGVALWMGPGRSLGRSHKRPDVFSDRSRVLVLRSMSRLREREQLDGWQLLVRAYQFSTGKEMS